MGSKQGVVTLRADPSLIATVPAIFKLHMFLGFTLFLIFPFTRLVHVWRAPLGYLGRSYQVVRSKRRASAEYEELLPAYARHGVGHAWLINPVTRTLEVFRREGERWVLDVDPLEVF